MSFGVRGLLVMALMLVGIGWIANATSEPIWSLWFGDMFMGTMVRLDRLRWWSTWIATMLTVMMGLRFGYRMWNWKPCGRWSGLKRTFVASQDGRGARWYRWFLISNLVLAATYAIIADKSWNRVQGWMWNHRLEASWQWVGAILGGSSLGMLVFHLGRWGIKRAVRFIRAMYGRRAPYEREIRELRCALEAETSAHTQLLKLAPMVGQCLATGIVRIRLGKGKPQSEQNRLLVDARIVLQNALGVLVTDEITRDAMLERARRAFEGEEVTDVRTVSTNASRP